MITVFTPAYNRKNELSRLYKSLVNQSCYDFIWYIVDDGSRDDTFEYINNIKESSPFAIEYIYQDNSGKHAAINRLLDNCTTQYAICVDSDDYLTPEAIEQLNSSILTLEDDDIWAIVGPKYFDSSEFANWNNKMPNILFFSEIYTKYKYVGETYMLWNLKCFSNIRFPLFKGEKFIPEAAIYEILDKNYRVRVVDKKLYVSNYQNDGLTYNSRASFKNNKKGYAYANLITSQNTNRSRLNRSLYYGRYYAIKIKDCFKGDLFNENSVSKSVKLLGSALGIPIFLLYYAQGKL